MSSDAIFVQNVSKSIIFVQEVTKCTLDQSEYNILPRGFLLYDVTANGAKRNEQTLH